jgi:DNA-directed RNA polymerase specialized sigma24 family protein
MVSVAIGGHDGRGAAAALIDPDATDGYQLFRRALVERDQEAWAAIERRYGAQLARWARSNRLYGQAGEEAEALANQALVRLWLTIGPDRFDAFPTLSSLLGYLRCCVNTLVIDQARLRAAEQRRMQRLEQSLIARVAPSPSAEVLERVRAGELWAEVRGHCRDELEERLAYGYLILGLKPSDLLAAMPTLPGGTAAINGALARLLRRLRRSQRLRRQWQPDLQRPVEIAPRPALRRAG